MDYAPPPQMITLRVSNSCNLRCRQCAQWGDKGVFLESEPARDSTDLSTEEWERFIGRAAEFCPHIYFFGGEPFLRKDLLRLVAAASRRNMITGINTNGNFLKRYAQEIVESGLDYLIVSLDGPKDVNNLIRLGKIDSYSATTEGIAEMVRAKQDRHTSYPLIELCMTLTGTNQRAIMETAEIARALSVDYFVLTLGIFTTAELAKQSREEYFTDFGIQPKFYDGFVRDVSDIDPELVAEQVRRVRGIWGSRYKQYPSGNFDMVDYFHRPEKALISSPCIAPWLSMQIMPNGDMAYCEDFADLVTGNIRDQDPLVLWNNRTSRAWRRRIRTKGIYPAETRCVDYYLY
jgi:MoaA/NifB/PqqE/SkfB family radical SAM enzyme